MNLQEFPKDTEAAANGDGLGQLAVWNEDRPSPRGPEIGTVEASLSRKRGSPARKRLVASYESPPKPVSAGLSKIISGFVGAFFGGARSTRRRESYPKNYLRLREGCP